MTYYIVCFIIGFLISFIFHLIFLTKKKSAGCIVINETDPNKDVYTLRINIPLGELSRKKKVTFDITHEG